MDGKMNRKGFTLFETIIVIAILAIVCSIGYAFFLPMINLFFITPSEMTTQDIAYYVIDEVVDGDNSAHGLSSINSFTTATATSIGFLDSDNKSVTFNWDSTKKKLYKTLNSVTSEVPFTGTITSMDGQSANVIFTYYDTAESLMSPPIANMHNIGRVQFDWKFYTKNAGNLKTFETVFLVNSGVSIKQFY